jgi:signal-transduction protein with cAMP-binding, CBS, and nucleotidyltransferase domain
MTLQSGGTVGDFMHRTLETVPFGSKIVTVAERMREKSLGSLLVESPDSGSRMSLRSGIVTETDLVRKVIAARLPASNTSIKAVMNYPVIQIDINRTVRDASRLMAEARIRHLAVTEDNKVVGLLSVRDLVKMVSVRDKPRFLRNT